jgi:hypothetical protein
LLPIGGARVIAAVGAEGDAELPQLIRRGAVCRALPLAHETLHRRSFHQPPLPRTQFGCAGVGRWERKCGASARQGAAPRTENTERGVAPKCPSGHTGNRCKAACRGGDTDSTWRPAALFIRSARRRSRAPKLGARAEDERVFYGAGRSLRKALERRLREAGIFISPSRIAELTQARYERSFTLPSDHPRTQLGCAGSTREREEAGRRRLFCGGAAKRGVALRGMLTYRS